MNAKNNKTCIKCGKANPDYTQPFLVVNVDTSSSTSYSHSYKTKTTTTTTEESLAGADQCAVCEECVKRARRKFAVTDTITALVGFSIGVLIISLMFGKPYDSETVLIKNAMVISLAAAGFLGSVLIFISRLSAQTPFVIARLYKKEFGQKSSAIKYIPAQSDVYCRRKSIIPEVEVFQRKTGLKTQLGAMLFFQFIAPGQGARFVEETLAKEKSQS